ncbi:hypothetical protein VN97_g8507 [Penicillium thymicola]|uniref:Secreted protein n=1 Tax=Penicillium thymicola TaxID=293382 RepID=A0AAI9TE06_PENTH|nr:hypothetical protein VN97_g8507 [Penicillium thymicola]
MANSRLASMFLLARDFLLHSILVTTRRPNVPPEPLREPFTRPQHRAFFADPGEENVVLPGEAGTKTYNSEDSLVVTHPTTNSPACGLSTAERTGSPIFHTLWSYVAV